MNLALVENALSSGRCVLLDMSVMLKKRVIFTATLIVTKIRIFCVSQMRFVPKVRASKKMDVSTIIPNAI
jgi:hypothetical protein